MSVNKWNNERPKKFFPKACKLFGNPTFVANVPNGMAYWKKTGNTLFNEHYIKDEEIAHCVPAKHHDYFYSSIKLDRALQHAFNAMTPTDTRILEIGGTFFGPNSFTGFGIQNMEGLNPRKKPSTKSWEKPESIEKGFCFFWSILYIEYKLNNPDIERKDIIPLIYQMARLSLDKKNNFQPLAILDDDTGVVELGKTISANIPDEFSRYYRGKFSAIKAKKIKYDFNSYIRSYALFMYIIMGYVTEIIELYGLETPEVITQKYEDGINRMLNYIKSDTGQKLLKKKKKKKKKKI